MALVWDWQCQLGHMQICTLPHTDNHTSTRPLRFLQAGCPSCHPTNSIKALKTACDGRWACFSSRSVWSHDLLLCSHKVNRVLVLSVCPSAYLWKHTHTTVLRLCGICPEQPGWASTRRSTHRSVQNFLCNMLYSRMTCYVSWMMSCFPVTCLITLATQVGCKLKVTHQRRASTRLGAKSDICNCLVGSICTCSQRFSYHAQTGVSPVNTG